MAINNSVIRADCVDSVFVNDVVKDARERECWAVDGERPAEGGVSSGSEEVEELELARA